MILFKAGIFAVTQALVQCRIPTLQQYLTATVVMF